MPVAVAAVERWVRRGRVVGKRGYGVPITSRRVGGVVMVVGMRERGGVGSVSIQ